ncbi:rRNA maturation RNase YbeY [Alsobacter sp. SYSU BS001988]
MSAPAQDPVALDVAEESPLWRALPDAEALAGRAVAAAARLGGVRLVPGAEVSLLLTDDAHMREINREWREKDKPTNVLSFPAVQPDKVSASPFLGDIAVAYETLAREALDDHTTVADHFLHLVVHGFLHLLGYDHIETDDAERMERLEVEILATLGVQDPYADRPLDEETPSGRMA